MISAEQVKSLRERTGAGIMECKEALKEAGGDADKAIDILRQKGIVKAASRVTRATRQGWVEIALSEARDRIAMAEVGCETDFVARTKEFQDFVKEISCQALTQGKEDIEALLALPSRDDSKRPLKGVLQDLTSKIGEKIGVARFSVLGRNGSEKLGGYVHMGNQIGVILKIEGGKVSDEIVRDIAMHVAAMNPQYISPSDVPSEVEQKEKDILGKSEDLAGKPENVISKMIEGRYRKFLARVCLTDQIFIKDPQGKQTVGKYLQTGDPAAKVVSFVRYQVGTQG